MPAARIRIRGMILVSAPAIRFATLAGALITAVSFASVLVILGFYFAQSTPHAVWYWIALWGFPVGFALVCASMLMALARRRIRA